MRALPIVVCGVCIALLSAAGRASPRVVWNTTASAPVGLYWLSPARPLRVGDWVFVRPQGALATWLDQRAFLPRGALLLKRIAAVEGDRLCWSKRGLQIRGRGWLTLQARDSRGRTLPRPAGCRDVERGSVLLIAPDPRSLDGRYFGPTPAAWITGRATSFLTWSGL